MRPIARTWRDEERGMTSEGVFALKDANLWRTRGYLDGAWCDADGGHRFAVTNPATGAVIAEVPDMGAAETQRAIAAAQQALPAWRARTARERATILRAWFDAIMAARDDLGLLLTTEQGKPLAEARGEVAFGASFVEWFAEEARRVYGDVIPASQADRRLFVLKQPVGVCAAITPWNFPVAMVTRKVAPALAVGCTVVLKPAEQTPLCALALAELAARAGVPKGVLNVITGDAPAIGAALTASTTVRKLSFTGSTEAGRLLMQQCAPTVKKLSLELGGNAPFLVFDDADLDAAVDGAVASKFRNAGQTCVCANRVLVQDGIYDAFARKMAERVRALVVGNGIEPGVTIGPLIDAAAVEKVKGHIEDAVTRGARIVVGGRPHAAGALYVEPTVLTEVTPAMRIAREETFGPVAPLFRFKDEAEAISLSNDTEYGLAAYLYARDVGRIWRVAEALEYGILGVNTGTPSSEVTAPFGGMKQSGIGREGSKYGIEEYLERKYVCLAGVDR
jgi:succinate-semialdehyde dehydrogenase/glutarate-semialdehyde dehydrogenase